MSNPFDNRGDSRDLAERTVTLLQVALDEIQRVVAVGAEQHADLLAASNSVWDAQLQLRRYVAKRNGIKAGAGPDDGVDLGPRPRQVSGAGERKRRS